MDVSGCQPIAAAGRTSESFAEDGSDLAIRWRDGHEFNNLLTAILGNLDLMRTDLAKPVVAIADRITAAEKAAVRANRLIKELRMFAGRDVFAQEIQSLIPVVQRVRESLSSLCEGRIVVTDSVPGNNAHCMTAKFNAEQLEEALMKLGKNALEAIGDGTGTVDFELQVVTVENSELLQITIRDSGSGMHRETKSRAFEPFFTTKDPTAHSGLGMAVAYGLIQEMNGGIQIVESTQTGTAVRVRFPLWSA